MRRPSESKERGSAMVEFAVSFMMLFSILAGTFQFGYSYYLYHRLAVAVRNGARYASMATYTSTTATPAAAFSTAVKNIVVYGNPAGGTQPLVPGLDPSKVVLTVTFADKLPQAMTVSTNNVSVEAVFGTITLNMKPALTFRYTGRFSPFL